MSLPANLRISCIGGGTGLFTLLSGLKAQCPRADLAAIVSMMDSGGSTGRLRVELGTLPPGDVRKCLVALSDASSDLLELMNYRFDSGDSLRGHNLGNLVLTAAKDLAHGEFAAIRLLERILQVRGHVYPVTLDDCHLVAELEDGREVVGEAAIDVRQDDWRVPVRSVRLEPPARLFDQAALALLRSDFIVLGPGDLYTSLVPNLMVDGMVKTLRDARRRGVRLIYVTNTMTKRGETDGYTVSRFVSVVESVLGGPCDAVVVSNSTLPPDLFENYAREGAAPVVNDLSDAGRVVITGDLMGRGSFAHHDPRRLAKAVLMAMQHLPVRSRPAA